MNAYQRNTRDLLQQIAWRRLPVIQHWLSIQAAYVTGVLSWNWGANIFNGDFKWNTAANFHGTGMRSLTWAISRNNLQTGWAQATDWM